MLEARSSKLKALEGHDKGAVGKATGLCEAQLGVVVVDSGGGLEAVAHLVGHVVHLEGLEHQALDHGDEHGEGVPWEAGRRGGQGREEGRRGVRSV